MEGDNKQDILTQGQMFKAPDKQEFIRCQADEIGSLYDLDIMDAHPISSLPPHACLLSSIWSYHRKHLPNGILLKYKSRLCVNGKEQAFGRDYWETYAPVAGWSTIWLLLYLSTVLNLKTRQVDYTSAFPQADLNVPVFMKVPQGCVIHELSKMLKLKDEGDVAAFIGVDIRRDTAAKTISFTQPGLIDQILRGVGLTQHSKHKDTPVDSILYPDPTGPARVEAWSYWSVIGKLNYLANNTSPDISMAVHQCAQFCSAPRALHELAVKRIAHYLLATRAKGLLLTPTTTFALDMYVDADFAGRWHREFSHLRDNVLLRTGYVITFCGCPVSWTSKLQSEIALSTTESEYIALSSATRDILPLRRILQDIDTHSFIMLPRPHSDSVSTSTFASQVTPSRVYEDNTACIVLATTDSPQFWPRTKHISLKFHHFKD